MHLKDDRYNLPYDNKGKYKAQCGKLSKRVSKNAKKVTCRECKSIYNDCAVLRKHK